MGLVTVRPALCHPARTLFSRGLCSSCYYRQWRRAVKPHPPDADVPVQTYPERYLPTLPEGHSHTFTVWPATCPHCRASTTLECAGREAHCTGARGGCGWTGYLIRHAPA